MSDSFLSEAIQTQDKTVLKNLTALGEKLKELNLKALKAEELAKQARKEFEHYANVIIPQEMVSLGVDSIGLVSGGSIKLKHNYYCQPNKNDTDKQIIADWLRKNGGEHLIASQAIVPGESIANLKDNNIPFAETSNVNTASLKAFLKDKLGVTTGVQQIKQEDIPDCIHFQIVTTTELDI